jgi:hypothetical protein
VVFVRGEHGELVKMSGDRGVETSRLKVSGADAGAHHRGEQRGDERLAILACHAADPDEHAPHGAPIAPTIVRCAAPPP